MLTFSRFAALALALTLLTYALGQWVGERTPITLLLAYLPPLVWLPLPVLALLWTLWRRRGLGLALAALLFAGWGAGLLHWRPQSQGEIRVLSYNVARGTLGSAAEVLETLRGADADLILLQETNFIPEGYGEKLRRGLPGYDLRRGYEVWTFSRLPVLSERQTVLRGSKRTLLQTEVRLPEGQVLTVVNAHLHTVLVSSALKGRWDEVTTTATARSWEVGELCRLSREARGPLLLGGDLNTPPRGVLYRRLTRCVGPDAHDAAGRGAGWTFPRLFLRIDHLLGRGVRPTRAEAYPKRGSDHLPLMTEFDIE